MLMCPIPDDRENRDNVVFDALLHVLSRPGEWRTVPRIEPVSVGLALIDRECSIYAEDQSLADVLKKTGANLVPLEQADHVFLKLDSEAALEKLARIQIGEPLYPNLGATIVTSACIGEGPELQLTGPGIEVETRLRLTGIHPNFWAVRSSLCTYPLGIELIIIDGERIVAIPRSTKVERV